MSDNARTLRVAMLSDLEREDAPIASFCTNLPGEGRELLSAITKINGPDSPEMESVLADEFPLTYFYARPVEMILSSTGELGRQTRVVLVTADLEHASSMSQGVVTSLGDIITFLGAGPWKPPIRVKLTSNRTRSGRNAHSLVVIDD